MPEDQPNSPPIDEALKMLLLSTHHVPEWIEQMRANIMLSLTGEFPTQPFPEKRYYQELWPFYKLTIEEINGLSIDDLAVNIASLESEDQDAIERNLPPELKFVFWELIESVRTRES